MYELRPSVWATWDAEKKMMQEEATVGRGGMKKFFFFLSFGCDGSEECERRKKGRKYLHMPM